MTSLADVTAKFVEVLLDDEDLEDLLGKDPAGATPVYDRWPMGEHVWLPSVSVSAVGLVGEVSGLNDGFDGSSRSEWEFPTVQVDVWAATQALRDSISELVRQVLFKGKSEFRSVGVSIDAPTVRPLNEVKPLIFRHSLSYKVFYILEVAEA